MDECSNYSKNTDSLDFLLLPVKKANNYIYKEFLLPVKNQNLIEIERNFYNKIERDTVGGCIPKTLKLEDIETNTKLKVNKIYHNSSKTIQCSVSDQENSIKQQHGRKILKGRKKVYHKIETTESAYSCDINYKKKYEKHYNKQEQITDLLKMDRYVRKEKKQKKSRLKQTDNFDCCNSKCAFSKNSHEFDDVEDRKSRVTIFGQLGLTQDDRYIMNCAATLNDKPIQTNYVCMDNNRASPRTKSKNDMGTMTTQGTQVNFNFSKERPNKNLKNKIVQCFCESTQCPNVETYDTKIESENIELKQRQSPLVVISVYPRQDSVELINKSNPVKIIRHQFSPKNKMLCNTNEGNKFQTSMVKKPKIESTYNTTERKSTKSRSPSPASENVKEKSKNIDTKALRMSNIPRKQSPLQQKSPDRSVHKFIDIKQNINNLASSSKNVRKLVLGKQRYDIKETNKEQVKKALVNTFLKNVVKTDNNFAKNKLYNPKEDASKITIDINGENEDYNVFLKQGKFDTGLCVQKTIKGQAHNRYREKNDWNTRKKKLLLSESAGNNDKGYNRNSCCINTRKSGHVPKLESKSKLTVKDSLEVCHRREERNSSRLESKETEKKLINGTMKHYQGDNCCISDPNERDQEIRKLLGVLREKRYQNREQTEMNSPVIENGDHPNLNKCYSSKDLMIAPQFHLNKRSPKKSKREKHQGVDVQSKYFEAEKVKDSVFYVQTSKTDNDILCENALNKQVIAKQSDSFIVNNNASLKIQNVICPHVKKENIILNPNIHVILQIEKNNRNVILTKKQYEKVKRIIKRTLLKKSSEIQKRKCYNINDIDCNVVSIGTIKRKPRLQQQLSLDRGTQTETILKCVEVHNTHFENKLVDNEKASKINKKVLDIKDKINNIHIKEKNDTRKVVSSVEIRYASVEFIKHISISSRHFENGSIKSFQYDNMQNDNKSLHTIFKGRRKCVTPNLGTSTFSLNSDNTNSIDSIKPSPQSGDGKIRKPFLQRLLSCLVMRSAQTSDLKDMVNRRKFSSRNTSLDSYNISSSLGALEMSSSIYDTSASFYSNHTITPINKTKRGFLNSVRGFLTIRRN